MRSGDRCVATTKLRCAKLRRAENPEVKNWIPAFAGMTILRLSFVTITDIHLILNHSGIMRLRFEVRDRLWNVQQVQQADNRTMAIELPNFCLI